MDLSFWYRRADEIKISRIIADENDPLIQSVNDNPQMAYQIYNFPESRFNTHVTGLLETHVYQDIKTNEIHTPTNTDILDFCRLIRFKQKILEFREQFYTSLVLASILNTPALLGSLDAEVRFVNITTYNERMNSPEQGIIDKNLYIPALRNIPESRTLEQLFSPLLQNRGFRQNQLKAFIESAVRSGMNDIRETFLDFKNSSRIHRNLDRAPIFHFQSNIRNALVHNYRYKISKENLLRLPITWRGYTLDASLNGQPMRGDHFPVPEFIVLADDIVELLNENIRQFPQIELNSPHIT